MPETRKIQNIYVSEHLEPSHFKNALLNHFKQLIAPKCYALVMAPKALASTLVPKRPRSLHQGYGRLSEGHLAFLLRI